MSNLHEFAAKGIELHERLNDFKYKGDIDAEYAEFFKEYDSLIQATAGFLDEGKTTTLHDCYIRNFSQRRQANHKVCRFDVLASQSEDKQIPLRFELTGKFDIRDIGNKEVYDLMIDFPNKQAVILYWKQGWMRSIVFPFDTFTVTVKT